MTAGEVPYVWGEVTSNSFQKIFYVATDGSDLWSGTLPSPTFSGNDGPFATLNKARNAVRVMKAKGCELAFTVLVRGGVYYLNQTIVLDTVDSGTKSRPFIFKAYEKEKPVLSGALKVSGFKSYKNHIYIADLNGIIQDSHVPRQLFAGGKRQILARYPNFDPLDPIGGGFLYAAGPVEEGSKRKFRYRRGEVKAWRDLAGTEVFIFPGRNWSGGLRALDSIDADRQIIMLARDVSNELLSGNRFYFQNLLEELDSPGEWYYDQKIKTLYFWPVEDVVLETVAIPVLKSILEVREKKRGTKNYGTPSYIRFEGFTLENCEGSAVVVKDAKKVVIAGNTIYNSGGNGIEIHDGFGNVAVGNDIYGIGGTGITISGGTPKTLTPANNRAENNHIYNTGVFEKGGASGILCRGVGNTISHNLIHSMPRVGIWFDGNDHLIENNHIHHVNQETQDSGMIYSSQIDWTKRGNIVRFNYLHDSGGYGRKKVEEAWQAPFDSYGIYLDDWTSGTEVFGNIIKNTVNGGIFIHGGRDNIIQNNVIIEGGRLGQMVYSGWPITHSTAKKWLPKMYNKIKEMEYEKHPQLSTIKDTQTGASMSGNSFVRNIIFFLNLNDPLYGIYNEIDLTTTVSDYNIIFHGGLPLLVPFTKVFSDQQWSKWQNMGFDRHSINANPLFADVKNDDFTLSAASPALKMGFIPIPFKRIGPYEDALRASWPIATVAPTGASR